MFHQAQAGDVAELLGEQRVEQRDRPSQNVRRNREGEFQKQQSADAIEQAGGIPLRQGASCRPASASTTTSRR
jgi:hypothetical protein